MVVYSCLATLPWSILLEWKIPASWRPARITYDMKLADFFNSESYAINFVLYFLFILINVTLLFVIGSGLAKAIAGISRIRGSL